MPGDRSLELNEYYGHSRNRFWKVIAQITGHETPTTYADKKQLLARTGIAVWDVVRQAIRIGSLDTAIKNEIPNELHTFIAQHPGLRTVAFNGKKSEALYDKYFERLPGIIYLSLPSTSPANAQMSFEKLCAVWQQLVR
jgi:hypoxanthine-DNA glycosylase